MDLGKISLGGNVLIFSFFPSFETTELKPSWCYTALRRENITYDPMLARKLQFRESLSIKHCISDIELHTIEIKVCQEFKDKHDGALSKYKDNNDTWPSADSIQIW